MGAPTFEMLWDCRHCGEKRLLGLSHRHCPRCGAPQASEARYFPPDDQKVAVADHRYVGADVACRYCGVASSKTAQNCGRCGAPLSEGSSVARQAAPEAVHAAAPLSTPPRATWRLLVPILLLVGVACVVVSMLVWRREQGLVVAEQRWQRTIAVERLGPARESAWCAELPRGAREVTRRSERRGSKRIADGEDCRQQKRDLGDGTFEEVRTCSPRFKDEPVYEDKCSYVVDRWAAERQEKAEGAAREPSPYWPSVTLAPGGEREGARRESYTVLFRDPTGETYRCELPEKSWSTFARGAAYRGQVRAVGGSLDCASLSAR